MPSGTDATAITTRTRLRLLQRLAAAAPALPPAVVWFHARALRQALARDDGFTLRSASSPRQVAVLLGLARGRRRVVELGTATGWTAAALVLADPERRVVSCDPVVQPNRERYLDLLRAPDRARLTLLAVDGADAAADGVAEGPVDLLFVDSSHTRDATLQEWHAWRPRLAPGALVVFDDHGHPDFPGVAEAVAELGLSGWREAGMFVWQGPGPE
ncbi:class I SAM-dependent methyltransferase [Conexibacter woesei]|uniref:class I SAM-dependent methyltransferase n=1 Tax=Conexibacter woesei TaxID=191495 RepID=UPI0004270594|nr:class I SAM-dependent methyltransferase [Conexibacter woesei]